MEGVLCYAFRNDELLMLRKGVREDDPNSQLYTVSGGKIDPGETPIVAVKREVSQETNYRIEPVFAGTVFFNNKNRTFDDWPNPEDYFVFVYTARNPKGKMKGTKEGEPMWIPRASVPLKPQHAGDLYLWEWVQEGKNFAGVITHKGKEIDKERTRVEFF